MMDFILLTDAAEDVDGFRNRRLVDQDLGESTLKGSILFNVLAVFAGCYVSDHEELVMVARKTYANVVAPIHRNFPRASMGLRRLAASIPPLEESDPAMIK